MKDLKRTATITWIRYNNFGSLLQAYALQNSILKLGFDNKILDDKEIMSSVESHDTNFFQKITTKVSDIKNDVLYPRWKYAEREAQAMYEKFKNDHLSIDHDIFPLESLNNKYGQIVCGSDQIWYPGLSDDYYYASFFKGKKIAYAPSIGVGKFPDDKFTAHIHSLLNDFKCISIREIEGASELSRLLGRNIHQALDPTLLLEKEDWEKLTNCVPFDGEPYILCYFLTKSRWYVNFVRKFADEKKLKIKVICTSPEFSKWQAPIIAGPVEFLSSIKDASMILTDSFHGSIFSILFEKDFYTFQRFGMSKNKNPDTRVSNLLSLLNLNNRYIHSSDLNRVGIMDPINYESVNSRLSQARIKSANLLKAFLNT